MKKLTYLFILASALTILSCSSDDDGASLSNSITYDGQEVAITKADISDYGAFAREHNYDFSLEGSSNNVLYRFYAELYSPVIEGNDEFRTGTFTFNATEPTEPAFYFEEAYIETNGERFLVDGGKITVSGSGTNFTFTTDVMLANDLSVTVSYDGEFTVTDRR